MFFSDDSDDGKSFDEPEGIDESQSSSNLRYGTGGRRHYRPRHHHRNHWVNEDTIEQLNGKGIIGHNDGIDEELNDLAFHPAGAKVYACRLSLCFFLNFLSFSVMILVKAAISRETGLFCDKS